MSQPAIEQLLAIMARLRDPDSGCPWDLQQTYKSIVPHTLEEAYEVADAIEKGDFDELKKELGDLLFQVVFYSRLAEEEGRFDFNQVVEAIAEKLLRRHPHVFAGEKVDDEKTLKANWENAKRQERTARDGGEKTGYFDDIPRALPSLSRANKIQKRVAAVGFDWPSYHGALEKISEEAAEIEEAIAANPHSDHVAEEIGDLLFATVNLSRHLKHDPEQLLRLACDKFSRRFEGVEQHLQSRGMSLQEASLDEMEAAWQRVKGVK